MRISSGCVGLALFAAFLCLPRAGTAQFYADWATNHFADLPSQSGPLLDADLDRTTNLVEFTYGTDPRVVDSTAGSVMLRPDGTDGAIGVDLYQREGRRDGIQVNLEVSSDLDHWVRPWWHRVPAPSLPGDPPESARTVMSTVMPSTNHVFVRSSTHLFDPGPELATYYVATNGADTNPGTIDQPFATLGPAVSVADPGDLIYVRGGTYQWTAKVQMNRDGSAGQPIRVIAYPGEHPVLDFSGQAYGSSNRGIEIKGDRWRLFGLEIVGAGDNGIYITGASNVVEQCVIRECRDSGLQLHSGASYSLILNCDSFRNFDGPNAGENADGFAAKFELGPGNEFHGCRAWENSDDGWDLWQATNTVVIEHCWTWRNGTDFWGLGGGFAGDGNGFKLGGDNYPGAHRIAHCIAFDNLHHGIDQNNNLLGQTVDHNTVWGSGARNFDLDHGANITPHVVRNNVSFGGGSSDAFQTGSLMTNNSWQILSPAAGFSDFLNADVSFAAAPRLPDGSLPETPFLRPIGNGRLVNQGVDVGEPFTGVAPDLGAFESPEW